MIIEKITTELMASRWNLPLFECKTLNVIFVSNSESSRECPHPKTYIQSKMTIFVEMHSRLSRMITENARTNFGSNKHAMVNGLVLPLFECKMLECNFH